MKRKDIALLLFLLSFLMPVCANAQALKGSYFMDNSLNRHRMNPAFAPRSNYFQLAGIGNFSTGLYSNLDIPTFLYPSENGGMMTFLHGGVSSEDFDKSMALHPSIDMDFSATLLSFGFYTKQKSFWTFDLGAEVMMDTDLPRDLFMFLKKGTGTSGQSYNIGNMNLYATGALQASLGYSRQIIDGLRVGIKANFIAPLAYASLNLENVNLTTGREKWNFRTEGYADVALMGLDMTLPASDPQAEEAALMPEMSFDLNRMLANKVLAGMGWSVDLGAEYFLDLDIPFLDGLSFSAAVTDLGMIKYKQEAMNSFKTSGSVDWVGLQNVSMENLDVEASVNDFMEEAKSLLNLSENGEASLTRSTMPRWYVGVEAPVLNNLMSVGLLYSGRIGHFYTRHELTASYNLTPCKWFSLGVNYSFLNTANTIGWILEFTPKIGPTFYIGGDYLPLGFASAPILEDMLGEFPEAVGSVLGWDNWALPMSWRLNLNFGIAFALGSRHGR